VTATRRATLATAVAAILAGAAAPAPKPPASKAKGGTSGRPPAPGAARWPSAPGDMSLGKPNAPVRIVEYLSLACPHCAHFHEEVFPDFKAKYIDTGRVYFTVRELLTEPVQVAAAGFLLARCGDGSKYFSVVDQVFKSQPRWRQGQIKPIFSEIAKANGFTDAQFEACITDEKAGEALENRIKYAVETDHVESTPTFFINGVKLDSPTVPTLPDLDVAIAKALQPAAKGRR
jgi:protein-disulfide isomerase